MTDQIIIELQATSTIAQAEALLKECQETVILHQNVTIDASSVEKVDSSIFQIIISLKKTLAVDGFKIEWLQPSDAFTSACRALGLTEYLELN